MKLISCQVALFAMEKIKRPDLLLNEINAKLSNIFDAMPMILNLPEDIPDEIPVVQAKSNNGKYILNITRKRVDFIVNIEYQQEGNPIDVCKKMEGMIERYYYSVLNSIDIIRVGMVHTLFEENENNTKVIFDNYLKKAYPSGCSEVSIRTNYQNLIKGMTCNNIFNIEAGELQADAEPHKGIIIQFDTNNIPDIEVKLKPEMVKDIVKMAYNKLKTGALKELI